jgi:uncharacterized repeat protein (TIGR02543 family)
VLTISPFITAPPVYANAAVTSGLVLNLNGSLPGSSNGTSYNGTTWFDQSGNARNATAVNSPTYNSSDGSFTFNGTNQYFNLGNILPFTSAFSIEVTFTPNSVAGFPALVSRHNGAVAGNYYTGISNSKAAYFVESNPWGTFSSSNLSVGTKYTVTQVYETNKDLTPYLNGVQNGTTVNHPNTLYGGNIDLLVGAKLENSVASSFFSGKIHSVRIYNRALTSSEVLQSYNSTTCSPASQTSGGYTILSFTSTTTCNWSVPTGVTSADVLIVGGGGAGGGGIGGGGGAGEFIETTRSGLTGGSTVTISVGAGGTSNNNWNAGNAGENSQFGSVIAYGGGGGGTNENSLPVASGGPNLGSQSGGGFNNTALTVGTRSDGITGFRNNGGSGSFGGVGSATAGGGGGAGSAGGAGTASPTQSGGAGGAGKSSSITGTSTFYAAGGGGGVNGAPDTPNGSVASSAGNPGTGGSGIGGSGGAKANAANPGNYGNRGDGTGGTVNSNGSAGVANTGSGGGGASNWVSGGAGGSGIVIVRYLSTYTVTYSYESATAGNSTASATFTPGGSAITLPTPTRSGYTFSGWYTATSGGSLVGAGGASYSPSGSTAAITLYAQWSANTNNAITYDNQGATTAQTGGSATYTTSAAIATIPTGAPLKTGYTFNGWYTASSGGTQVTNGSYTPASPYGGVTLYAQWTINTYSITLNRGANGSGSNQTLTKTYGVTLTLTDTTTANTYFTRTGYTVSGWTTTDGSAQTHALGGSFTTNAIMTLYPVWVAVPQSITYNSNNGSGSISATTGNTATTVTLSDGTGFTRTGYTLSRWDTATAGNGGSYTLGQTNVTMPAGGLTLYAVWSANSVSITTPSTGLTGTVGTAYSLTLSTSGGSGSGTFSIVTGSLPSGVNLNSSTGVISGTPTANGTFAITAQITDANTAVATTSSFSIAISLATRTLAIDVGSYTSTYIMVATPPTLTATASAGTGAKTFTSSTTGVCTVNSSSGLVAFVAAGTCTISASIAADSTYASATSSSISFTTTLATQTITRTSTSPVSPLKSGTYTPTATASSSLTVAITIASGSASVCSISAGLVTFDNPGSCVIQYNQSGNTNYAAAAQVTETLTIGKLSQTITFGLLSNKTLGSGTVSISATTTSTLAVTFISATSGVCTIVGSTITLVAAGTCTISANQSGDSDYTAASQVQQSFTVAATLSITTPSGVSLQGTYNTTFTSLTISSTGGAGTKSFAATGSLPAGVTLSSSGVISGTPSTAGDFSLTVTVTDANGVTATTSSFTISIAKGVSTVALSVPTYTYTGSAQGPDSVTKSGSSGDVTYAYVGRGSTTYTSSSTKPTNVGTYTVTATVAADSNFASISTTANFEILSVSLVITPTISATTMPYGTSAGSLPTISFSKSLAVTLTTNPTCALYLASDTGYVTVKTLSSTLAVGSYVVNCKDAVLPNYTITYGSNAAFSVTKLDIAQPNAPNLSATAGVLKSIAVSWTAAANATSYILKMYASDGTTLLAAISVSGSTSKTVTASDYSSIADSTNYKFTITALGDAVYADSSVSAISSAVTTNSSYTITYSYNSANGGATTVSDSFITGGTAITLPTPTKTGYTFAGWYSDSGLTISIGAAAAAYSPTGATTALSAYAKWTANVNIVTFNANDGSGTPSTSTQSIISGTPTALTSNTFTRTGHAFAGWTAAANGTGISYTDSQTVTLTAGMTIYAKWTANVYNITYAAGSGGSGTGPATPLTVSYGATFTTPANTFTKTGFTFAGWNDGSATYLASATYPATGTVSGNVTLTATWTGNICSPTSATAGGYTRYTFTSITTCYWDVPVGVSVVDVLAVAGGAGGGYAWDNAGAGGGAGGQVITTSTTLSGTVTVSVGQGGAGGTTTSRTGVSGTDSSIGSVTARAGTGGCAARSACSVTTQATALAGAIGGAGGVGGASGRGGGGSSTVALAPTTSTGGTGTSSNYSGSPVTYGVGGAGGTPQAFGSNAVGVTASANTGNGGGGASAKNSSGDVNGGAGGSGLIIVRVANANIVVFDANTGSGTMSDQSILSGTAIALTSNTLTKTGYAFAGWNTNADGISGTAYTNGQSVTITAGMTLFAKWTLNTYPVAFDANTGSGTMGNQSITHGVATNLNANLFTRANYVFYRWATAANGTGSTYSNLAAITLTSGTTLYAQWTPNTYVVTYNYDSATAGSSTVSASFTTGGLALVLPTPTKTGYTFAGWYSDSALTSSIGLGGTNYSPTGSTLSLNAYAKWIAVNYTFTYDGNSADSGAVPTETSKQITQTATIKANTGSLIRAGYTFSGWNTESNGTGANYLSGSQFTVGSSNVVLYAKWSANTYTVTYNVNSGIGNAQRSSNNVTSDSYTTDGSAIALPGVGSLERSGYTFGGWNTSAAGTGTNRLESDSYTTVSDVTFYVKWNAVTYSITYNGNTSDGGSAPTPGGYTTGQASPYVILSNTFTKTSSIFGGWNTASNGTGTNYSPGASITTLSAVTLYAVWIPQFTLHYAVNGGTVTSGSLPGDTLYTTGASVGPVFSSLSRNGYRFDGWTNGATTIALNGYFTILADSVLTAKWTAINYVISYNSDGGSDAPATETKQIGQSYTVGSAVFKPGYNFTGWWNGSSLVGADAVIVMGSNNITYTAQWAAEVYRIAYDWNGGRGTAVSDISYTFGTPAITLPLVEDRVKDGYTFAGWSQSLSGSLLNSTYIPSQSRTLYAQWSIGNFTITYDAGRGNITNSSVAVLNGGSTVLPLPTRANFVFTGWYTASSGGTLLGSNGSSFTPTSSQTVYARWIQSSLYGITDSLSRIGSIVTADNVANSFSGANSNSSVVVSIPANAFVAGTTINFDLVGNSSRALGLLNNVNYLISIAVSWLTGDETVPDTAPGKPFSVTISNATIKAGASAYAIVNNVSTPLGTATQDGTITVSITSDPEIVVAATKPNAPTSISATSNGNQQSVISWSAPISTGGSAISGYTVTANTGATCTSVSTSCTISSLSNGTTYSFTVTATNSVGTSEASLSASATTASLYSVAFNAKGGTAVSSGSFLTAATVSEPTAPTRAGYAFAGWSATDGGSAEYFPYSPNVTNNITMYARWDALDNAVSFNSKGGSTIGDSTFPSGGTVAAPGEPSRSGYTFAGWSATDGGSAITFPYAPRVVSDITLFANWNLMSSGSSGSVSGSANTGSTNVIVVAPVTVTGSMATLVPTVEISVPVSSSTSKPVGIKIDSASAKFITSAKVVDGKIVITPETGFSGKKSVTITITQNGIDRTIQIPLTVLPEVVSKPVVTPVSAYKSMITWSKSPNANSYKVYLDGKRICSTSTNNCSVARVLGPESNIEIVSNGGDRTISEKIGADFKQSKPVVIGRIYSASMQKADLNNLDTKALDKVAALIKSQGFSTVVISNITTSQSASALASARIAAIKKYITEKVGDAEIAFEVSTSSKRTYFNNISLKG